MLCRRPDSIPERNLSKAVEAAMTGCCGRSLPLELQNNTEKQLKHVRSKISIKSLKNSGKSGETSRMAVKCPSLSIPLKTEAGVANQPVHNRMIPKLNFTYVTSPTKQSNINSLPTSPYLPYEQPSSKRGFNGPPSFSNRIQPNQFINQITNNHLLHKGCVFAGEDDDTITVRVQPAKTRREQPLDNPLESLPFPNLVKVPTTSTNDTHRRQLSQTNPKVEPAESFQKQPRIRNFERGTLFKAVRKSQTINTDAESDSSSSIVIQDYKSLMSKIHETKEVEQQQYEEI